MHRTPKHELADVLLGEQLLDWIAERRPATSWQRLSVDLSAATGGRVLVTPETLRSWHVAGTVPTEATA